MTPELELPEVEILGGYQRLVRSFGAPRKEGMTEAGWVWAVKPVTRGWTTFEFRTAVRSAAGACRYFPRAKDIAEHRPFAERHAATPAVAGPDVCPSCEQHRWYAGYQLPDGTVHPRLRCACPPVGAGWHSSAAKDWREDDAKLQALGYSREEVAG